MATQKGRRASVTHHPEARWYAAEPQSAPTRRARPAESATGTIRADRAITNSQPAYNMRTVRVLDRRRSTIRPPSAFPKARPAMKTDRTMATIAAVTPKRAMARRSQTTWHSSAQNPEMTKKAKNQRSRKGSLRGRRPRRAGYTKVSALCEGGADREQSRRMSDATFADLRAFMGALRRQGDL